MYAIVEIAGQQFKAEKGRKLYVHRLPNAEGEAVSCASVMLIERDGKVIIGAPLIQDAVVEFEVLRHLKDDKIIIFKKKRRKGYRVKNGHRQYLTQILINDIVEGKSAAPKAAAPKATEDKVAPKAVAEKVAPKVATEKAAPKKAAAPKAKKAEAAE